MNTRLIPCAQCARHVRDNESVCPFCEAALSPTALAPVERPHPRWSRSQRLAAAAAVAGGLTGGCAETKTAPNDVNVTTGGEPQPTGGEPQPTGGSAQATGGVSGDGSLNDTGGVAIPPYGIPATGSVFGPPPTGGSGMSEMDGGTEDDAGSPEPETGGEIFVPTPIYGAPIPEQ